MIAMGDKVRVVSVPTFPGPEDPEMQTQIVFNLCVGRVFVVVSVRGGDGYVELEVGKVMGEPSYMHSIWLESKHVERAEIEVTETLPVGEG